MAEGGRILIIGASGGCGIAALQVKIMKGVTVFTHLNHLQIAKEMKAADIVGVCSGKNEALVREHGATDVIDYTKVLEDLIYMKYKVCL